MGANVFMTEAAGADVREAFCEAVRVANYEHGHGGYSGTLAEKHDFVVVSTTPRWLADAEAFANSLIDANDSRISDKWGPAGAVPFVRNIDGSEPSRRDVVVTVTVKGDDTNWGEQLRAAVDAKVQLRPQERVERIVTADNLYGEAREALGEPVYRYRYAKASTPGARVTRYIVEGSQRHGSWETGFDSQAAAAAYAVEASRTVDRWRTGSASFGVSAVTRREDGSPLMVASRTLVSTTLKVRVSLVTFPPLPAGVVPAGWLFFGWASS